MPGQHGAGGSDSARQAPGAQSLSPAALTARRDSRAGLTADSSRTSAGQIEPSEGAIDLEDGASERLGISTGQCRELPAETF
jgi:hypothetical protein